MEIEWDQDKYEKPWRDPELLRELYINHEMSTVEIANELGCSQFTSWRWIDKHNIETRKSNSDVLPRPRTPDRGGSQGYEMVKHDVGETVRFRHHRLIAVAEYGLDDVSGMVVHHKNGIPWDNRPENLELMQDSEHVRYHQNEKYRDEPWRDRDILHQKYVVDDQSFRSIGRDLGCSHGTVKRWLKNYCIIEDQS